MAGSGCASGAVQVVAEWLEAVESCAVLQY